MDDNSVLLVQQRIYQEYHPPALPRRVCLILKTPRRYSHFLPQTKKPRLIRKSLVMRGFLIQNARHFCPKATPHNYVCGLWRFFPSTNPLRKLEIHKVFLHFRNKFVAKNSSPNLLAELCGIALNLTVFIRQLRVFITNWEAIKICL